MKRSIIAILAILAVTNVANANFPGQRWQPCDNQPPAIARLPLKDFVHTVEKSVPGDAMWKLCGIAKRDGVLYGCTWRIPHYLVWRIYLNNALTPAERACTVAIEHAHLPPNRWSNPAVEGMVRHTSN